MSMSCKYRYWNKIAGFLPDQFYTEWIIKYELGKLKCKNRKPDGAE